MTHPLSDRPPMSGGCQCGAVRYRVERFLDTAHLCHCRMCQKAAGNVFAALVGAPDYAVRWTRGVPGRFRSSEHVDRGFCRDCGTPLFFKSHDVDRINLMIGSLDDPAAFQPKSQAGTESRMPWFAALADTPESGPTVSDSDTDEEKAWAAEIARSSRQHPDHDMAAWPQEKT